MARLPFKLTPQTQERANIGRGANGQFVSIEQQTPAEINDAARQRGEYADDVVREARVPDRLVGDSGKTTETPGARQPTYAMEIPWPEAGPINDTNHKPMRLKE